MCLECVSAKFLDEGKRYFRQPTLRNGMATQIFLVDEYA